MAVMSEARAKEIAQYLDKTVRKCSWCPLEDICDKACENMWEDVFKKRIKIGDAKRWEDDLK